MNLIAAVDLNWAIGYKNEDLFNIPADRKFFKEKTLGQVVIMGRKTFQSLPGKRPLKSRINIIVSGTMDYFHNNLGSNVVLCQSLDELFDVINSFHGLEKYVIGGECLYAQLLPYCSLAYITRIMKKSKADKYMLDLDSHDDWKLIEESDRLVYDNNISFSFLTYQNLSPMKHQEINNLQF